MIGIHEYISKDNIREASEKYYGMDPMFGCTEFLDRNYWMIQSYPFSSEPLGTFITVYEKREEHNEFPRFIVDIMYGEGDQICFSNSIDVINYLISIFPMIEYTKEWEYQWEQENGQPY